MPDDYQRFRNVRFFGSLDGLRALSIFGVIWAHTWYGWHYQPLHHSGELGVDIFFTISGFLITTLLLREKAKRGSISLRDFYIRRALRIWPLYYFLLAIYVLLVLTTKHGAERSTFFHNLPFFLTYTYTWFGTSSIFGFSWSLSTEEQFYVFWPLIVKTLRSFWPVAIMLVLIVIRLIVGYGLLARIAPDGSTLNQILINIWIPICSGAILAYLLNHPRTFRLLYVLLGSKVAAPVMLSLLVCASEILPESFLQLVWLLLPCLVAACVIREDNGLAPFLRFKPIAHVGVLSYGMYLYCNLVVLTIRPLLAHIHITHPALILMIDFPTITGVAWLSYHYFESPFLKLKQRFSRLHPAPSESASIKIKSAEADPIHP